MLSTVAVILPVAVPPEREKTTVKPPVVNWLLFASCVVRVKVEVVPDATVPLETASVEVSKDTAPGITIKVGKAEVNKVPPTVARIVVAVPATKPLNVAE